MARKSVKRRARPSSRKAKPAARARKALRKTARRKAVSRAKSKPARAKHSRKAKPKAKAKLAPRLKQGRLHKEAQKARLTPLPMPDRPAPPGITIGTTPLPLPSKTEVGKVSHYFTNIGVAVVDLKTELKVGDKVSIEGQTTNFIQTVISMQVNRKPVPKARKGESIGLKILYRARPGDIVYRL